jgi:hypothetical protein
LPADPWKSIAKNSGQMNTGDPGRHVLRDLASLFARKILHLLIVALHLDRD